MRMILVDVCREHTMFHRINVENGVYERPIYLKNMQFDDIVTDFIKYLWLDRPQKVVIDHNGFGASFKKVLEDRLQYEQFLHIDEKGNVTYE